MSSSAILFLVSFLVAVVYAADQQLKCACALPATCPPDSQQECSCDPMKNFPESKKLSNNVLCDNKDLLQSFKEHMDHCWMYLATNCSVVFEAVLPNKNETCPKIQDSLKEKCDKAPEDSGECKGFIKDLKEAMMEDSPCKSSSSTLILQNMFIASAALVVVMKNLRAFS